MHRRLIRLTHTLCSRVLIVPALCLIVSAPAAAAERRVALVIGNAAYWSLPRLDGAKADPNANDPNSDAELMADTLRALGFTLLGGRAQLDLDKAGFERALRDFGEQVRAADVALFYYAGHGVELHGTNYMMPVDADPAKEADVAAQLIDVAGVLQQLDAAPTGLNLVILDASRANPLRASLRAAEGGLAALQPPPRTLMSFAARPGRVVRESDDGHYTRALARQMLRPGLDVLQTFHETELAVKRATGGRQEIVVASSSLDSDFQFTPTAPARPPAPAVAAPRLQSSVFPTPRIPPPPPPAIVPSELVRNAARDVSKDSAQASVQPSVQTPDREPAHSGVADPHAVLYDEDPSVQQGRRYVGTVTWRTEPLDGGGLGLRALVDVPERGLRLSLLMRRNSDPSLPATHTAELSFTVPATVGGGSIDNVPGLLMKATEQARGVPLAGRAVKVAGNVFLVGLSSIQADVKHNLDLLHAREWIDIPLVYASKRRAILAIEKGLPGERAFDEAFAAWGEPSPVPAAPSNAPAAQSVPPAQGAPPAAR